MSQTASNLPKRPLWRFFNSKTMKNRFLIFLIALDHLMLVLLTLGNCMRGETISASAWRQEQAGRLQGRIFRPLIDALFHFIEKNHCSQSWLAERHMYRKPL